MNGVRFLCLVMMALVVGGCSSSYLQKKPRTFEACMGMGENARQKSFETIYALVNRSNGWRIDSVDEAGHQFKASVYRGRGHIPMLFSVRDNGSVDVIRDPERPKAISRKWANTLKGWINRLENHYSQKRCM